MTVKFIPRRLAPLIVLPLLAALPAQAQPAQPAPQPSLPTTATPLSFEEIFAGVNPAPLTLKTADLKGEWRLVTIRTRPELEGAAPAPSMRPFERESQRLARLREALGAAPGQFITQGQTVGAGGELFLVAYRMKFSEADFDKAIDAEFEKKPPGAILPPAEFGVFLESYARERPLELSLINVKLLGEISGVHAFNADTQAAALRALVQQLTAEEAANAPKPPANTSSPGATPKPPTNPTPTAPANQTSSKPPAPAADAAARNTASLNNLKQLGIALRAYTEEHDGLLPPMGTPAQAKTALAPLAGSAPVWTRADTSEAYRPNPMLSGRKTAHISNPDEFVAFYEMNPAPDGTRGVVFLSGTVRRLTQAEWPRYKKASKLP